MANSSNNNNNNTLKQRTRYYYPYRYTYRYLPVALVTAGVKVPGTVLPVYHTRENSNHTAVGSSAAYRYQPATWYLYAVITPLVVYHPPALRSFLATHGCLRTWYLVPGTRYTLQIASQKIPPSCRNFVQRTTWYFFPAILIPIPN